MGHICLRKFAGWAYWSEGTHFPNIIDEGKEGEEREKEKEKGKKEKDNFLWVFTVAAKFGEKRARRFFSRNETFKRKNDK